MQLLRFCIVILILILAGCESNVKYPSQSAVYYSSSLVIPSKKVNKKPRVTIRTVKPVGSENKPKIVAVCNLNPKRFLKAGKITGNICLSYELIRCRRFVEARRILVKLEKKQLSNVNYGRVYALLGMINAFKNKSGRDYFEIAYAYDPKNRIAKYMLTAKKPSLEFALQFGKKWCLYAYKR